MENKQELMEGWLDKQYEHHSKNEKDIREKIFAAVMSGVKKRIPQDGWAETLDYITEEANKNINCNMVGPYALAQAYIKVIQKMKSLNLKEEKRIG